MEWRPVRGFENEYLVSDSGDIKSVTRNVLNKANCITVKERILKPWIDNWGYMNVCLFKNGKGTCKKVHSSASAAAVSIKGNVRAAQANISAACVGYLGKKTAYGYMWRYES